MGTKELTERPALENLLAAEKLLANGFRLILQRFLRDILSNYPIRIISKKNGSYVIRMYYSSKLNDLITTGAFSKHLDPICNLTDQIKTLLLSEKGIIFDRTKELEKAVGDLKKTFETLDLKTNSMEILEKRKASIEIESFPLGIRNKVHLLTVVVGNTIENIRSETRKRLEN